MTVKKTLGVINNNPNNLRPSADTWFGQTGTATSAASGTFIVFSSMEYGIRAAAINMYTYVTMRGKDTLRKLVYTYAPAADKNNPASYLNTQVKATGLGPDDKIDITNYDLVKTILVTFFTVENGAAAYRAYIASHVDAGLNMAIKDRPESKGRPGLASKKKNSRFDGWCFCRKHTDFCWCAFSSLFRKTHFLKNKCALEPLSAFPLL